MNGGIGGDGRGSLPYAVVAVVVLILAASWSAAAFVGKDSDRALDMVEDGETAMGSAAESVSAWVERGLGEMVAQVSSDGSTSFAEKEELFGELVGRWMGANFPATDSGITVDVSDWHISLSMSSMQIGGLLSDDGYTPAFLVASGTVDAVFDGDVGSARKTLDVSADAGSALPLTAERGSVFGAALTGSGSLLSQLMTYQLSALAQYRILNGWGGTEHGADGTWAILGAEDVERSYRSCTSAISSLYLSSADGGWVGGADAASKFLSEGSEGYLTVDLGAIYADALYGMVDDIVLKWFDYFGGGSLLGKIDGIADGIVSGWEAVVGFLTGRDTDSAADYIRKVCGDADYMVHPDSGFALSVPDGADTDGNPRFFEVRADFPSVDILSTEDVKHFHSIYRGDRNGLLEWVRGMVRQAVAGLADSGLGVVRFDCASNDGFPDLLVENALKAVRSCADDLIDSLIESVRTTPYVDQFSSAICDYAERDKGTQLLYSPERFAEAVLPQINGALSGSGRDAVTADELLANTSFRAALETWRAEVDRSLSVLEPLRSVSADNSSLLRDGCIAIIRGGMDIVGMINDEVPYIERVCREIGAHMAASGFSGIVDYPAGEGFELVSDEGRMFVRLGLECQSTPDISISVSDRSSHSTGFGDRSVASYTTVWDVVLKDAFVYTVSGEDAVSAVTGSGCASYSAKADVDLKLSIAAVSGLPLAGVGYSPSNTLTGDLWNLAVSVILDLVDPLMELMRSIQEVLAHLQEAVSKLYAASQGMLERIYEVMLGPAYSFRNAINDRINEAVCSGLVEILGEIERTYSITAKQQAVKFSYGGWDLEIVFFFGTLGSATKHIVKTTLSGPVGDASFSGTVDLKLKGSRNTPAVTGSLDCSGDGWHLAGTVDPFMRTSDRLISVWGDVGGTDVLLDIPVLYSYNELDLSLRDVPALAPVLSNIPFLIPGTTLSVDAGLDLKYDFPVTSGVMINEIEANPEGEDRDGEWAEVVNLTRSGADLSGWTLTTSKGRTYTFPEGTVVGPGGRTVAEFEGIFLLNSSETLVLRDAEGSTVDSVGPFSDGYNDGRTYQRGTDGMTAWGWYEGTKGERNGGALFSLDGAFLASAYSILSESAGDALSELGGKVTTEEGLAQLVGMTLKNAVDRLIDSAAAALVEASAYVEAEVTDPSSALTLTGVRIHLTADEDLAGEMLRYVVGNVAELVLGIDDPYNVDLGDAFAENVFLGVTVFAGAGLPSFIDPKGDSGVELGVDVSVSVSGLSKALGKDDGTSVRLKAGVVASGLPFSSLPGNLSGEKGMSHDLWAFRLVMER